jgi:hypothetical protein
MLHPAMRTVNGGPNEITTTAKQPTDRLIHGSLGERELVSRCARPNAKQGRLVKTADMDFRHIAPNIQEVFWRSTRHNELHVMREL